MILNHGIFEEIEDESLKNNEEIKNKIFDALKE